MISSIVSTYRDLRVNVYNYTGVCSDTLNFLIRIILLAMSVTFYD